MRGVSNAKEARAIPALEPVYAHGEELDVVPARELADPIRRPRRHRRNPLPERFDGAGAHALEPSLGNHESALPVAVTVDQHEDPARIELAHGVLRVAGSPAQPEPQHVHGRPELAHAEAGLPTDEG